jgi:hypothetical protein
LTGPDGAVRKADGPLRPLQRDAARSVRLWDRLYVAIFADVVVDRPVVGALLNGRGRGGLALALVAGLCWGLPAPAAALVGDLTAEGTREAIEAGMAAITQEDFVEEWQLRLPGGEDVVVSTPFSRLALAARQATMKGESLTEKQQKEQIDRGKGRIQLLVTMHGGPSRSFARFYQPVLLVNGREVKATFVQNERTPLVQEDGRLAARNVYVFPLEGLPTNGAVTLLVRGAPPEQKEVLRAKIDLGKFR